MKEKEKQAMNTRDIDGVEIFAVGTWHGRNSPKAGDSFTVEDLDEIVAAFTATKNELKPYLKIGHGDTQKLLERDELPAAGWVENLRRVGNKLVADFKRVPQKVHDLIAAGAYSRVSIELYGGIEAAGRTFKHTLGAVSILGGATPAVTCLADIIALYGLDVAEKATAYESKADVRVYDMEKEEEPVNEELKKALAELAVAQKAFADSQDAVKTLTAEKDALTGEVAALKASVEETSAKFAAAQAQIKTIEAAKRNGELKSKVDALVVEKKIVPAQKDLLYTLLSSVDFGADRKFKMGEKEFASADELILAFVSAGKAEVPNTESESGAGEKSNTDQTEAAKKYASEHKVSFREALITLSRQKGDEPEATDAE